MFIIRTDGVNQVDTVRKQVLFTLDFLEDSEKEEELVFFSDALVFIKEGNLKNKVIVEGTGTTV